MKLEEWLYVAPQRIRAGALALPKCTTWAQFEALNMQRLARVFEFQGCIGFVGSGASANLGYPSWQELLPQEPREKLEADSPNHCLQWEEVLHKFNNPELMARCKQISKLVNDGNIDATQAIQMVENLIGKGGREAIVSEYLSKKFFTDKRGDEETKVFRDLVRSKSPFGNLIKLPIRRFVTTNYDLEIERELKHILGTKGWSSSKSFEQDDQNSMAVFAVALASANRNMVFHCHGTIHKELKRLSLNEQAESTMVLTDADYNHWYLSRGSKPYTFQRSMDVILQSNPLLFVGYSIADVDLLRILRRANLRWESERIASNLFLLLKTNPRKEPNGKRTPYDPSNNDDWKQAKQIKFGVNLIPFDTSAKAHKSEKDRQTKTLSDTLTWLSCECSRLRQDWRIQPKVKSSLCGPRGIIESRKSLSGSEQEDPLFSFTPSKAEVVLKTIHKLFFREKRAVVAIVGSAGSGKLLKACQYAHIYKDSFSQIRVFHSYNNDDLYSYHKRIKESLSNTALQPVLVIINNIDLLLGNQSGGEWKPRNKQETQFLDDLIKICKEFPGHRGHTKVLITAQSLNYPQNLVKEKVGENHAATIEKASKRYIKEVCLDEGQPFTPSELLLKPPSDRDSQPEWELQYKNLRWELQYENSGLILATRYIDYGDSAKRTQRLSGLLEALQANSSEMGTRVVRHIVRSLDSKGGRKHEILLWHLSCFNTPFARFVFDEVCGMPSDDERHGQESELLAGEFNEHSLNTFLSLGLLQKIGPEPHEIDTSINFNYIVPPIVKRYFREVLEKTPHYPHAREFGLHGLLSSGPFNGPGYLNKPKQLFEHFVKYSFSRIEEINSDDTDENTVIAIRAALDILRSNFACNSVPLWGEFRDYIDMLSISIDLVRNYAKATGDFWYPARPASARPDQSTESPLSPDGKIWKSARKLGAVSAGVASAEEMLYLYNELGLTFYQTGSVQDALRVWGLATDWRKVLEEEDPIQGEMYNATLNSHLGTAYMQLGRMQTARECFDRAIASAKGNQDPDLECRMRGMLARIDHFRGNVKDARKMYVQVISKLGKLGNRRAQCYFMRHLAALEARFGDIKHAAELANQSMAIAASENAPDLMAFASELKAKVYRVANEDKKAMHEYSIAWAQAERLDIARLKIDILLGKAEIQLRLGDVSAARNSALDSLKLANEHLLVLRQAKALIILGNSAAAAGDIELAKAILKHAMDLAAESQFRLTEHDARGALAALRTGNA